METEKIPQEYDEDSRLVREKGHSQVLTMLEDENHIHRKNLNKISVEKDEGPNKVNLSANFYKLIFVNSYVS